jgi:hypothetical protein
MSSVSTTPNSADPGIGRRVMTVCRVDDTTRRTGAMTCWTASMACVPISINAPAPAVAFA